MKFSKKTLARLPSIYAVSSYQYHEKLKWIAASEAQNACIVIDAETTEIETVWDFPGGTMQVLPLPGDEEQFLAVQHFYPVFNARNATIVHAKRSETGWKTTPVMRLPYLHRFDILERGGIKYLILCTLCSDKDHVDDWSHPGSVYVCELPNSFDKQLKLKEITHHLTRNHGYCRVNKNGYTTALVSSDEGIFEIAPPQQANGNWSFTQVMNKPVSDMAICDLDGDGVDEIATIEPFHGNDFIVYKQTNGQYTPIYRYPEPFEFGHIVWGGKLRNTPVFIGGCRSASRNLFLIKWKNGEIVSETIDQGAGPSNITVVHNNDFDYIFAANGVHEEASLYTVTDR